MNNKIFGAVAFSAGILVGSATTYQLLKNKFEEHIQSEIDSIKEYYKTASDAKEKPDLDELAKSVQEEIEEDTNPVVKKVTQKLGYIPKDEEPKDMFEILSPMEFGTEEEYDELSFTYYADGVLANELNEEIKDVAKYLGDTNALNRFGEYEDDSVFVRNHVIKADIEILLDESTFASVRENSPHPIVED